MVRTILAVVAGAVSAVLTIALCEFAAHAVFPPPPGVSPTDPAAMAAYAAQLPSGALLLVLAGWVLGAFDGALVAALVDRARARGVALAVGLVVALAVIANALLLPQPGWMTALGVVLPLAAAYGASRLAHRLRPARPVAAA